MLFFADMDFLASFPFLCSQVKGTVFMTDMNGALVDITAKSSAYLPVQEACIHKIKHVSEAGIYPGLVEEFVIIGEHNADDSLILSLRSIQYDLAWERCRQLQAEDVIVKGKVRVLYSIHLLWYAFNYFAFILGEICMDYELVDGFLVLLNYTNQHFLCY